MQKTYLFLFLALCCITLQAQEIIVTSGGELSGSGGQASYTIGQTVYHTRGEKATSSEGVQQSLEYLIISGEIVIIEHHSGTMLICENNDGRWHSIKWYRDETLIDINNYIYEENGLNGVYYAVVTDAEGHEYYSQRYYYSTDVVASKSLIIYPVPLLSGEDLNILYSNSKKEDSKTSLQLFDLNGNRLIEEDITIGERGTINTSRLKPGVYTITIDNETSKIIVK